MRCSVSPCSMPEANRDASHSLNCSGSHLTDLSLVDGELDVAPLDALWVGVMAIEGGGSRAPVLDSCSCSGAAAAAVLTFARAPPLPFPACRYGMRQSKQGLATAQHLC